MLDIPVVYKFTMKKYSKELQDQVIKDLELLSQKEVAKKYNIHPTTVSSIYRERNVSFPQNRPNQSRLKLNINYFDEIDSPEKAYWLGLLAADGSLKNNKVKLISKDLDIIQKFKSALESEHKISLNEVYDKRTNKTYVSYTIQVTSNLFCQKVSKYIPINKSEYFNIPNIDIEYYPEFIAGMVDGDGSFFLDNNQRRNLRANLISTKECLEEIQEYLCVKLGINKTKLQPVSDKNVYKLYIYSGTLDFLKLIYRHKNKTMFLDRKQEKLKQIFLEKGLN